VGRPHLVICDLDGTLVDSFGDIRRSIITALAAIDVTPTDELLDWVRKGISLELYFEKATGNARSSEPDRLKTFVDTYRDSYFTADFASEAYESVPDTLAFVRKQYPQLRVAVATTKRTDMARVVVDRCGLDEFFDLVQGSDNIRKKPNPDLLQLVAEKLDVPVTGAMMLGDTDKDVLAAKAAGCVSVAVTYGGWTRAEMLTLDPDHLVDDFSELRQLLQ